MSYEIASINKVNDKFTKIYLYDKDAKKEKKKFKFEPYKLVLLLPIFSVIFTVYQYYFYVPEPTYKDLSQYTIDNYNEELEAFTDEDMWQSLSQKEKTQAGQIALNCILNSYGLNMDIPLYIKDTRKGVGGYYSEKSDEIIISPDVLDNRYNFLYDLSHEAFHVYEYALVRTYNKANSSDRKLLLSLNPHIEDYNYNINHYINYSAENKDAYENQVLERDAYTYGMEKYKTFYKKIQEEAN